MAVTLLACPATGNYKGSLTLRGASSPHMDQPRLMKEVQVGETFRGGPEGGGRRVAVVVSRFNRLVTDPLLAGALEELARHGVADADVDVAWVPGSLELPLAA